MDFLPDELKNINKLYDSVDKEHIFGVQFYQIQNEKKTYNIIEDDFVRLLKNTKPKPIQSIRWNGNSPKSPSWSPTTKAAYIPKPK